MKDINRDFSQIVKDLVGERFSKTDLASRCGCSRSAIYEIIDGRNTDPRWSIAAALVQLHDYHVKGNKNG